MNALLALGGTITIIGVTGMLLRKNLVIMLMSLELTILGGTIGLIGVARLHAITGAIGAGALLIPFIFVIAAAEACVGLTLIMAIFKTQKTLWVDEIDKT